MKRLGSGQAVMDVFQSKLVKRGLLKSGRGEP